MLLSKVWSVWVTHRTHAAVSLSFCHEAFFHFTLQSLNTKKAPCYPKFQDCTWIKAFLITNLIFSKANFSLLASGQ